MQKIIPNLWFDKQAEEAVNFYMKIFKNSAITVISRYSEEGAKATGQQPGSVMTIAFQLNGHEFLALNGGPHFKFTEAISFAVECDTQQEIDEYWEKLSEGGHKDRCGWLKDKFGLSWQIVPTILSDLMKGEDTEKTGRVMKALLKMDKLDIATLQQVYNG